MNILSELTVPHCHIDKYQYDNLDVLQKQKSFVKLPDCIINHILLSDELSPTEKLYYLVTDFYSSFLNNWDSKTINFSATKIGKFLGLSQTRIFSLQKSLEEKGYLIIKRTKDRFGKHNVNVPSTTLPDHAFSLIMNDKDNFVKKTKFDANSFIPNDIPKDQRRNIIDKYALFIPINFEFAKAVFSDSRLSHNSKLIYILLFATIHKIKQKFNYPAYVAAFDWKKLASKLPLSRATIYRSLEMLQDFGYIRKRYVSYSKTNELTSNKFDKPIPFFEILIPNTDNTDITAAAVTNAANNDTDNATINAHTSDDNSYTGTNHNAIANVEMSDFTVSQIYLSEFTDKPSIYTYRNEHKRVLKKIDKKRKKYSQFRFVTGSKDYLSNFLNNSSFKKEYFIPNKKETKSRKRKELLATSTKMPIEAILAKPKLTLGEFYPLTDEDVGLLRIRSGRDFSKRAMNEILKDVARKMDQKENKPLFVAKNSFLKYMVKLLKHEKRDAVKTNNETFRIKANMTEEERIISIQEKYLTEIEYKREVSSEWSFKKKLAGVLQRNTAYKLLKAITKVEVKIVETEKGELEEREIYQLVLHCCRDVEISEIERSIILKEAMGVYDDRLEHLKIKIDKAGYKREFASGLEWSKQEGERRDRGGVVEAVNQKALEDEKERLEIEREKAIETMNRITAMKDSNSVWDKIRLKFIETNNDGIHIDYHWLSKLKSTASGTTVGGEKKEIQVIALKAPNDFYKQMISERYFYYLEKIAHTFNIKLLIEI